jgi:hypothetical protein
MSPDPYDERESQLTNIQNSFKNGVCTKYCRADTDCPKDMTCEEVVELIATSTSEPYKSKRCTPLAWQSAPE